MATTATPKPEPTEEPVEHKPKTARITPEYRKAHKNYVLVAALLASWELIGIELNTQDKWGIKLLSPRAVPLILFTLLVYCAYKVIIEWNLEDDPRPKSKRARIDYYVAHAIGLSAVLIGAVQALLRIRVADVLTKYVSVVDSLIIAISFVIGLEVVQLQFEGRRRFKGPATVTTLFLLIAILVGSLIVYRSKALMLGGTGMISGVAFGVVFQLMEWTAPLRMRLLRLIMKRLPHL